jgi:hypothetical protein
VLFSKWLKNPIEKIKKKKQNNVGRWNKKTELKKKTSGEPLKPRLISRTCNLLNSRSGLIQEDSTLDQFNVEWWNELI